MVSLGLAQADLIWARARSFESELNGTLLQIRGTVPVCAYYNGRELVICKEVPLVVHPLRAIKDDWLICLTLDYALEPVPVVMDSGGRLEDMLRRDKLKLEDLHLNSGEPLPPWPTMPKSSFCVAPPPLLIETYQGGFRLPHYFRHFLIPFLYQQSYRQKNKDWPWDNYSHGLTGINEFLRERRMSSQVETSSFE